MTTKCPLCGASEWNIWCETTLVNGPGNETTYHCNICGYSWKEGEFVAKIAPVEYKLQSQYGVIKDWLEENYWAKNKSIDVVYEALCQLLDKLDEATLRELK